jgi:predicted nuclease of predicted toxin-antitoxin system
VQVLLDACVWGGAATVLNTAGHEVEAVADWVRDPGDSEILDRAFQASQVIVTIDKDFGELVIVRRLPHCGVIRLVGIAAEKQGTAALEALTKYGTELAAGAIVTVEPGRVRVRPPEPGKEDPPTN